MIVTERTDLCHPPTEGTPLDPAFPTSSDYPALPEPAQSIRDCVLRVQGVQFARYARGLRKGDYGRSSEEKHTAMLAEFAASWRRTGSRPASWWNARLHLHPLTSDWSTDHLCSCGRATSFLHDGLCRSCEPMECCAECGLLEPLRDLDAAGICPRCALLPLERDGEPVEAHEALVPATEVVAAVLAGRSEVRRAA